MRSPAAWHVKKGLSLVATNLGADQLRLDEISQPAWVWDHDRARVVDANGAALALWQEPSVADLMEREFDPAGSLVLTLERQADQASSPTRVL